MNTKPLSDLAADLEHGGITKKLAARKLRDWIKENKNFDLPLTPIQPPLAPMPTPYPQPRPPFGYGNSCPKCGITLAGIMGYSCPISDCPVGLGPILCGPNQWSDDGSARGIRVTFTDGSAQVYDLPSDSWEISWRENELARVSVNGAELRNAVVVEYLGPKSAPVVEKPKHCSFCHGSGQTMGTPYDPPEPCRCKEKPKPSEDVAGGRPRSPMFGDRAGP